MLPNPSPPSISQHFFCWHSLIPLWGKNKHLWPCRPGLGTPLLTSVLSVSITSAGFPIEMLVRCLLAPLLSNHMIHDYSLEHVVNFKLRPVHTKDGPTIPIQAQYFGSYKCGTIGLLNRAKSGRLEALLNSGQLVVAPENSLLKGKSSVCFHINKH